MATSTRRRRPADDEELEETQPRRRRRVEDDDEAESPRGRRRAVPEDDDDDEDVEEAPRARRSAPKDDDEDEDPPRRRRGSRAARDDDEDDEEDAPRQRRGATRGAAGRAQRSPGGKAGRGPAGGNTARRVASGWGGHKSVASGGGSRDDIFQLDKKPQVVKVLEDQPFAAYRQHWIPAKNRSFVCLKPIDGSCPLCDIGDKPNSSKTLFNIVEMSNPEKVLVWQAGAIAAGELEDASEDDRWDGLSDPKLYFEVYSKKKGDKTEHKVNVIRSRDLPDDWDLDPLTAAETDALGDQLFDEDFVRIPTQEELEEVADDLV
ncbi:hypothetical protein ACFYP4_02755 [Streptomyces sp. NPDC005551]|uniref:hypothetical protein n=1 Tax=Streptomyces sp. NPDC005551 TaxID=3364725 RepID=UPI0036C034DE